jgi:Anthrone oxygenase
MNAAAAAELTALLCGGLFAGAAAYISIVEHPARVACGTEIAVTEFRPSYKRATVMQVTLVIFGFVAAMSAWWLQGGTAWLIGGLLLASVIPVTLFAILPTNHELLNPTLDLRSERAAMLLQRWGRLHALRTLLSIGAFLIFLLSVLLA